MKPLRIEYSPQFKKRLRRIPKEIQEKAIQKEQIFRNDIFDPRLRTHKLKGELNDEYSFSVDYHWRIVFYMVNNVVRFDTIGTHEVYR